MRKRENRGWLSPLRSAGMLACLMMAIILGSCSGSHEAEVNEMLANVPAEAEFVGVLNLSELASQVGSKVKDGGLEGGDKILKYVADLNGGKSSELMKQFLTSGSGVEWEAAVCYIYQGKPCLLASLADAAKFKAMVDAQSPGAWTKADGNIEYKKNIAIHDSYVWIGEGLTAENVARWINLSDVESFKSAPYAPTLSKSTDALSWWASMNGLLAGSSMGYGSQTQIRLGMGMLFNSPQSFAGTGNVGKDGLELTAMVFDANQKPSKCELKLSEIDTKQVAALSGNANYVLAVAVSQKLVQQIKDMAGSIGGALPAGFEAVLSPLDGTIAVAGQDELSSVKGFNFKNYRASIATNGKNNAQLGQMLQAYGALDIQGDLFNLSQGDYGKGGLTLTDVAEEFKGAWFGLAVAGQDKNGFSKSVLTISPEAGSIKLKVRLQPQP